MSEELKPCPFCGGIDTDAVSPRGFMIKCFDCGACGPDACEDLGEAASRWNRRPIEDDLRAQLAALQAEKEAILRELVAGEWTLGDVPGSLVHQCWAMDPFKFQTVQPQLARWLSEAKV